MRRLTSLIALAIVAGAAMAAAGLSAGNIEIASGGIALLAVTAGAWWWLP